MSSMYKDAVDDLIRQINSVSHDRDLRWSLKQKKHFSNAVKQLLYVLDTAPEPEPCDINDLRSMLE